MATDGHQTEDPDGQQARTTPPGMQRLVERIIVARPVDDTLVGIVLVFRTGSLLWMLALVISTLANDPGADRAIVLGSMAVAIVWTALTFWAARARVIGSKGYAAFDGLVALAISLTPGLAGAEFRFFGGMPLSWLFVAALAGGLLWAWWASAAMALLQVIGVFALRTGYGPTEVIGQIMIFLVPALVIGFAFDTLRWAEGALAEERTRRALETERADVAARLHDSVLQTLSLIQARTEEPETKNLARRERRKLRGLIDRLAFGPDASLKGRILEIAEDVEDDHLVSIETAIAGNDAMDEPLERLLSVVSEGLVNAAKHSGCDRISLFVEVGPDAASATVKDDGGALEDEAVRARLVERYRTRMGHHGEAVSVDVVPGELTVLEARVRRIANVPE
jgi:signal transduction histidine kinase